VSPRGTACRDRDRGRELPVSGRGGEGV
jgi:hypothetical protein